MCISRQSPSQWFAFDNTFHAIAVQIYYLQPFTYLFCLVFVYCQWLLHLLYEYLLELKKLSSALSSASWFCPRPRPRPRPQEFGVDQHHCLHSTSTIYVCGSSPAVSHGCLPVNQNVGITPLPCSQHGYSLQVRRVSEIRWMRLLLHNLHSSRIRILTNFKKNSRIFTNRDGTNFTFCTFKFWRMKVMHFSYKVQT